MALSLRECEMWFMAIGNVNTGTLEKRRVVCRQERCQQCCYCHWVHLLGLAVTRIAADPFQRLAVLQLEACFISVEVKQTDGHLEPALQRSAI